MKHHKQFMSLIWKVLSLVALEVAVFLVYWLLTEFDIIGYVPEVALLFIGFGIAVAYAYLTNTSSARSYRMLRTELGDLKVDVEMLKSKVLKEQNEQDSKK